MLTDPLATLQWIHSAYGPGIVHSQCNPCRTSTYLSISVVSLKRNMSSNVQDWFLVLSSECAQLSSSCSCFLFPKRIERVLVNRFLRREKIQRWKRLKAKDKTFPCCVCKCSLLLCRGEWALRLGRRPLIHSAKVSIDLQVRKVTSSHGRGNAIT